MPSRSIFLAVLVAALAVPGAAFASTLTADAACYGTGQQVTLSGTGFTPIYAVELTGGGQESSIYPEDDGSIVGYKTGIADNPGFTPRPVTLSAHDQVNAANDTSVTVLTVRTGSNLPVRGKAGATVTWQFGGFPTGATIYGHYRYGHNGPFRTVKDVRFGTAQGPCGTLTTKAKRVPVKHPKRGGGWYLQVDTKPKFHSGTRPEYDVTFSVR